MRRADNSSSLAVDTPGRVHCNLLFPEAELKFPTVREGTQRNGVRSLAKMYLGGRRFQYFSSLNIV